MISIIKNKIKIDPQQQESQSVSFEALLGFEVVEGPLVEEPVSLKLVEKFCAINLLPQFPQNIAHLYFHDHNLDRTLTFFTPFNKQINLNEYFKKIKKI